jgi:Bcr/CflA subfamily drug resistance transporter
MFVPSLPYMAVDLNTTIHFVKSSITFYFLGLGISPLLFGPYSDRFGRRKMLLFSASVGLIGTIFAIFSGSMTSFLLARCVQGIGLGMAVALTRTIARDLYQGTKLAEVASVISLCVALGPAIAPVLGGYIQHSLGWRYIFIAISGYIAIVTALIFIWMPETAKTLDRKATKFKVAVANYKKVMSNSAFMGFVICSCMTVGSTLIYFTLSPFILQVTYHFTPVQYGWVAAAITFMTVLSRGINVALVRQFSAKQCIQFGLVFMSLSAIIMLVLGLMSVHSPFSLILPMMLFILGAGFILSNALSGALQPFHNMAGVAAASFSSLQMLGAFVVGSVASFIPNNIISLSVMLLCTSSIAWIASTQTDKKVLKAKQLSPSPS